MNYKGEKLATIYKSKHIDIYEVSSHMVVKNCLMMLSVVRHKIGVGAFWSTHIVHPDYNAKVEMTPSEYQQIKPILQGEHIKQVKQLIRQAEENEPNEFRIRKSDKHSKIIKKIEDQLDKN